MNPSHLQPEPKAIDIDKVRRIATTLANARLTDDNCASWYVANRRLHALGHELFKAIGEEPRKATP